MIPTEISQAVIIALGNFFGILTAYFLLDRRMEGKINKYLRRAKTSPEGQDLFKLVKDVKAFMESNEMQELLKEARAGLSELRSLLKKIKERAEEPVEDDGEAEELLPSLEKA